MEELQEVEERIMFDSYLIRPVLFCLCMRGCFVGLGKLFRMVDEGIMTYDHLRFYDSIAPLNLSPSIYP